MNDPGYSYVAARQLKINGILAFTPGQEVPDSTVASQGWVVGTDVTAVGTPGPTPQTVVVYGTPTDGQAVVWSQSQGRYVPAAGVRAASRRTGSAMALPPVGTRTCTPNALSNGTNTGQNTFLKHWLPASIVEIRLVYVNFTGIAETATGNPITLRVGWQRPDGTVAPVYFNGSRTGTLEGGYLVSDVLTINREAYGVSRTNVAVTAGQKWPQGSPDNMGFTEEGAEQGTSITDKSLTGTIASGGYTGVPMYGPTYVQGRPAGGDWTTLPATAVVGDSIPYGQGDNAYSFGLPGRGYVDRAFGTATAGYVNMGVPTEKIADFITGSAAPVRMAMLQGMYAILAQHGRNDLFTASMSTTTMYSLLLQYWNKLAATGARVYQATLTPTSSSTDGWTTAGGQTTDATNPIRTAVNDWMRDGAPMHLSGSSWVNDATGTVGASIARCNVYSKTGALVTAASGPTHLITGIFDPADAVETSRNSGLWKPDPNQRVVTDAVMTSGSDLLGSIAAGFTTGDATYQRNARVAGAGASGAVLWASIRYYPGGTNVNLTVAASTTVSGATATIFLPPTTDGVHPGPAGAVLMAAAIPIPVLTASY